MFREAISRRRFLEQTGLGIGSLVAGASMPILTSCTGKNTDAGARPNIVVFVGDDVGWRDVGYHGSEIKTPTLDRMAKEGVELNNYYVFPTCSPTRASLLTGRPASRFGIFNPIAGRSTDTLPKATLTLPELLRSSGYSTAITGKWHLGLRPESGPLQYGFDYSFGYLHGQLDPYTHLYKNGDRTMHRNDQFIDEEGHMTDLITSEAVKYVTGIRDKGKPFFLYVNFSVPHFPLKEEEKWEGPYRETISNPSRRVFAAAMTHMDHSISLIMEAVNQVSRNTLFFFTSDNGGQESWLDPGEQYGGRYKPSDMLGDNLPLRGWKGDLYEGGIRVPALLYWKDRLKPGKIEGVISVTDILPTLAHLAGASINPDANIEGKNIWSLISGAVNEDKRTLYWRTPNELALRQGSWKLIHHGPDLSRAEEELFDIASDPLEKVNQAESHPEILRVLQRELENQFRKDSSS